MFVGTIRDISERKASEQKIASEASRLDAVLNTVLDGLLAARQRWLGYINHLIIKIPVFAHHHDDGAG